MRPLVGLYKTHGSCGVLAQKMAAEPGSFGKGGTEVNVRYVSVIIRYGFEPMPEAPMRYHNATITHPWVRYCSIMVALWSQCVSAQTGRP